MTRMLAATMFIACLVALTATNADAGFWLNGRYYAKGVQCQGEATVKNIDKNMVSLACSIDPPTGDTFEVILVCQNPGGNISIGRAFVDLVFDVGLGVAQTLPEKKGKTTFNTVVNGEGITPPQHPSCPQEDAYCNCGFDEACRSLRDHCPNDNWLPIDATPISMTATAATYFCSNDGFHNCPCDPSITDPTTNVNACATATGIAKSPWSFDWSVTNNQLVPAALEVSECTLPNPDTWRFGENRQYDCTVILDQST